MRRGYHSPTATNSVTLILGSWVTHNVHILDHISMRTCHPWIKDPSAAKGEKLSEPQELAFHDV